MQRVYLGELHIRLTTEPATEYLCVSCGRTYYPHQIQRLLLPSHEGGADKPATFPICPTCVDPGETPRVLWIDHTGEFYTGPDKGTAKRFVV